MDRLFTLAGVLEGAWAYNLCFVNMEKAYDWVPRDILWEVLREYGVRGPFSRPSNPYILKARAACVYSEVSRACSKWVLASASDD